jgi:hypothetical protein
VIRQAISCDICGTEKRQTNHWFVADEQAGELRVRAWGSHNRMRGSTKHLCGQTCLHKLVDEFMARSVAGRMQTGAESEADERTPSIDASLTPSASYDGFESSARLLTTPDPAAATRGFKPQPELVAITPRAAAETATALPPPETPRYASRSWHAEAWERERARELRAAEQHPEIVRRRSRA